jgi:hypothetical protein
MLCLVSETMSSLSRLQAGRKKESRVWDYFSYQPEAGKSKCVVVVPKGDKECGVILAGKNSTHMLAHLSRMHKQECEQYLKVTQEATLKKRPGKHQL